MVDLKPVERLETIVTLQDVKENPKLSDMALIKELIYIKFTEIYIQI